MLSFILSFVSLDGTCGHSEEHVPAQQEVDQGADRVVDRAQVHEEGR